MTVFVIAPSLHAFFFDPFDIPVDAACPVRYLRAEDADELGVRQGGEAGPLRRGGEIIRGNGYKGVCHAHLRQEVTRDLKA